MGSQRLDDAQLQQVLADLRAATEVDTCFGGRVGSRSSDFVISHTDGARTHALHNLQIRCGLGLGGKAISLRRPVWVRDYPEAQGITHDYDQAVQAEQLRAVFAIPLVVDQTVYGVVYGALRQDLAIGDRVLSAAELVVRHVARYFPGTSTASTSPTQPPATMPLDSDGADAAMVETLRDAHAELVTIAAHTTDETVRQRLTEVANKLTGQVAGGRHPTIRLAPRELAVLTHIGQGRTNAQVAEQLGILPGTVKAYLQSAMRKLGTGNRWLTVCAARRAGLLP
ncbi:MAG: GAF domain-containing protein [Pseudonocardiaceae bacterium]|nr:GAF domain-containing protein [Pseudonocardiaceae bacterium]